MQEDAQARARVSRLLPQYRDPDVHWYDDFEAWLRPASREAGPEAPLALMHQALGELSESPKPLCRMRARRLFAIAVAARAFPQLHDADNELRQLAVTALRVESMGGDVEHADALFKLAADETLLTSADGLGTQPLNAWWDHVVVTAYADHLLESLDGMRPRPCSGRLVQVPGLAGPAAALKTEFETDEVDFDAATRFIAPTNWKKCMPYFWCEMKELRAGPVAGQFEYHEVVSSDCQSKARALFSASTDLLFNFMWLPDAKNPEVAIANYQLAADRPRPNDLIRLDEGTLVVAKVGPGQRPLRVTTTKRIQFAYPFSSQALVLLMCALGYADVVAGLLCCASREGANAKAGRKFPGVSLPLSASAPQASATGAKSAARADAGLESGIAQLVQDSASIWGEAVSMWGRILREGASAMQRGPGSCAEAPLTAEREKRER